MMWPHGNSVSNAMLRYLGMEMTTCHRLQWKGLCSVIRESEGRAFITRAWHEVPEPPETSGSDLSVWGMMVDTSERPYSFRPVRGNTVTQTQIYDTRSRSWSMTSSVVFEEAADALCNLGCYSCMCHDGCIYLSLVGPYDGGHIILVYSIEEDHWSELALPPPEVEPNNHTTLGVWDDRIFAVVYDLQHEDDDKVDGVIVWELVDAKKQKWEEYAACSVDLYNKITDSLIGYHDILLVLLPVFCDEYLLVCSWQVDVNRSDTLVMFNFRSKTWELVGLPMGTVSIED